MMNQPTATIRPLTQTDIPGVVAIAKAASDYPWTETLFRSCLKANYRLWILQTEEPIGFIVLLDEVNETQLLNIAVLPEYQRQGYGRYLLSHAIEYAKSQGFSRLMLEVRASNAAAISLYHALGFIDVGIRHRYYPKGHEREDALLMTLEIN